MKRAHQQRRDHTWAKLHINEHKTIKEIAELNGVHRNTVSRAVNHIITQQKEAHDRA